MAKPAPETARQPSGPIGVGRAVVGSAAVAVAMPTPAPARRRPMPLVALPGGRLDASSVRRRIPTTPAMLVASFVLLVLTVGAIVAVQIRVTQISERVGDDLGRINVLQQRNTALQESNNRMLSAARVNTAIAGGKIIEPDVSDLRFLHRGAGQATVSRALRALQASPPAAASTATATGSAADTTPGAATGTDAATPAASSTGQLETPGASSATGASPGTTAPTSASTTDGTGPGEATGTAQTVTP